MADAALVKQIAMSDPTILPSTRRLLTALINTLATSSKQDNHDQAQEQTTTSNPLLTASETTKSTLLTLHTLFPTDLLPALDLLDRGLVTRFVLAPSSDETNPNPPQDVQENLADPPPSTRKQTLAYYVRSSRSSHPRSRAAVQTSSTSTSSSTTAITTHSVHLNAWTCSCPAFAFAAFPAADEPPDPRVNTSDHEDDDDDDDEDWFASTTTTATEWRFGGLTRGDARAVPPVCKHLLACVIAERCGSFAGLVEERQVGVEEAAGWAAGWGD